MHAFLRWALGVLVPGTGRRRAALPAVSPPISRPCTAAAAPPRPLSQRSPYGLHDPLDGGAAVMVRPYVVEAEREQHRQSRRRLALVLAADFGIDLDAHVIGAEAVA
ncbi:hypothetical protein IQ64_31395 [Streptomyces stelliscabiei]|nr:hypothetical protein IQ64_31395 [Streptomyces stelliscabiei]